MAINVSNKVNESVEFYIGALETGHDGLGIGVVPDELDNTVFAGVGGGVSQDLKAITGSNLLTGAEVIDLLAALLTSEGKRGRPEGVDGVEVVDLVEDAVTLQFEAKNGAVDTITFTFEPGLLDARLGGGQNAGDGKSTYAVIDTDKGEGIIGTAFIGKADSDYSVGGSLKGEQDTATILEAALDNTFDTVQLVGFDETSFTVMIDNGQAIDTYTFTGRGAVAALDGLAMGLINPGNRFDQFVFVDGDDSGLIGIGTANRYDGAFGGQLMVEELVAFVANGDTASGVTVTDVGADYRVDFEGNQGSTDTILLSGALFDDVLV